MNIMLNTFDGVMTVILIIAVGFWMEKKGWFNGDGTELISKLVNIVCLPPYMVTNLTANFDRAELVHMAHGMVVPCISILAALIGSNILIRILKIPREHSGIFNAAVGLSNVIFIGLPLTTALFGDDCVPYVMLYYMANTVFFWTYGMQQLCYSAGLSQRLFTKGTFRNLMSPPFCGFLIGLIMVLLGLNLPSPIFRAARYVGSMTTPLAMIFIGVAMARTDWKNIRIGRDVFGAMFGRFVLGPVTVLMLLPFFDLPPLMAKVFVVMAAMPAMTNISILTKGLGGDYKYGAMLSALSAVLAIIVIPIYVIIITHTIGG